MQAKQWASLLAVTALGFVFASGCVPTIPIPVDLNNVDFDTESGIPTSKTLTTSFDNTSGLELGSGSLQVDPGDITFTPDQAKTLLTIPASCDEACSTAGVAAVICDNVCTEGELIVTVWVDAADAPNPQTTGDKYGPFVVALNDQGDPVSVTPSTATLQAKTIAAVNAGSAEFAIEVISPFAGVITIESFTVNAGL